MDDDVELPYQVLDTLSEGHSGASLTAILAGDDFALRVQTDLAATVRVKLRDPHGQLLVGPIPIGALGAAVTQGMTIEHVAAPDADSLAFWAISSWSAGSRGGMCYAEDLRGLAAMIFSGYPTQDGRTLGDALFQALTRSKIEGIAARMQRARTHLGDDAKPVAASGVADYFFADKRKGKGDSARLVRARFGDDGGPPLCSWGVYECIDDGSWVALAESPDPSPDSTRRRSGISQSILSAIEADAFGTGIHSPRSTSSIESLEPVVEQQRDLKATPIAPVSWRSRTVGLNQSDQRLVHAVCGDDLDDERSRAALRAAGLTPRQAEVVILRARGLSTRDIALDSGKAEGTIKALGSQGLVRLRWYWMNRPA